MVPRTNFVPNCGIFCHWLNFRGILCSSVFLLFRGICWAFSTSFCFNRLVFDGDYFAKLWSEREVGGINLNFFIFGASDPGISGSHPSYQKLARDYFLLFILPFVVIFLFSKILLTISTLSSGSNPLFFKKKNPLYPQGIYRISLLAESEGFEPSVPLRVQHLSRVPRSTAPATLRKNFAGFCGQTAGIV